MQLKIAAATGTVVLLGLLLISGSREPDNCAVTLRIVDADTGETLPGLIRE